MDKENLEKGLSSYQTFFGMPEVKKIIAMNKNCTPAGIQYLNQKPKQLIMPSDSQKVEFELALKKFGFKVEDAHALT